MVDRAVPVPAQIIDAHTHVGGPAEREGSPDQLLRQLASIGAERAVSMPAPGIEPDNNELDHLLKPYQGRLFPCAWVNPLAGDRAVQTVNRCAGMGWRFLKLQPNMHQFSLLAPATLRVVEAAAAGHMLILIHTGGSSVASPWAVGKLASKYPEARMVVDHMGGGDMEMVNAAIAVAEEHPNLYLGTSQMLFFRKYREAVARVGANRILFGSDAPVIHPKPEFERVRVAALGAENERLIFGGNIAKFLPA